MPDMYLEKKVKFNKQYKLMFRLDLIKENMNNYEISLIYITTNNVESAISISNHLISKRLIACSNMFPINSIFRWNNELKNENEYVIICKTLPHLTEKLDKEILEIHGYDIPCIIKIIANVNEKYFFWIQQQLN